MRTPGTKPKPTELKLLEGNPGKRRLSDAVQADIPAEAPAAPDDLEARGAAAWAIYWESGRPWLAVTDQPLVERLCRLIDTAARIGAVLRREGETKTTRQRRSTPSPLLAALLQVNKQIGDLESVCGFTPTDRARMKAAPDAPGELARWMAGVPTIR